MNTSSTANNPFFNLCSNLKEFMQSGTDLDYSTIASNIFSFNFDELENINFNLETLMQTISDINEGTANRNSFSMLRSIAFRKFFNESPSVRIVGYI